jgi:hypothetical protein
LRLVGHKASKANCASGRDGLDVKRARPIVPKACMLTVPRTSKSKKKKRSRASFQLKCYLNVRNSKLEVGMPTE